MLSDETSSHCTVSHTLELTQSNHPKQMSYSSILKCFNLILFQSLMPNLHDHFKQLNIETHMFSSQWFLTLFTAKFPLNMVYHVLDMFLCEVM